jgi:hypothetical protein
LSDPIKQCPTLPEKASNTHRESQSNNVRSLDVWPSQTMSGSPKTLSKIWILVQRLDSWDSPILTHPPPITLSSWQTHFPIERVHHLYSKSLNSLSHRASIQSSLLEFKWSKDSSPCVILHLKLVFAVESSSFTLVTLGAWLLDG